VSTVVSSNSSGPINGDRATEVTLASGLTLSVVDQGPASYATPFLLVHGLASNKHMWDGVANALTRSGHRSIAVDLRGHGRSSKPDNGWDFDTITSDLVQLLEALNVSSVHIAGQSWGGNVVLEFGIRARHRVKSVACIDGGVIDLSSVFATWEECEASLAPPHLIGTQLSVLEGWIRKAHPHWPDSGIQGTLACFETRGDGTIAPWLTRERHLAILRSLYGHRPTDRFASLHAPTLLIPAASEANWASDKRVQVEQAISLLPQGFEYWFDPGDHDLHAQYPQEIADLLVEHAKRAAA
jgi:pimeloyl-ACP methyl ester carboxylesterase